MAEDRNQFTSIYGDAEDEFEIEDVSDETLTIPTEEIRAVREEEIEAEAQAREPSHADEEPAEAERAHDSEAPEVSDPAEDPAPSDASDEIKESDEPFPEGDPEPYSDEELEGVTFEDSSDRNPDDYESGRRSYYEDDRERALDGEREQDADKVSILSYIGHAILFTIPVIGTILMLIYIISDNKNPHLRHLAQIWLVTLIIASIGLLAAAYIFGLVV